MRRILECLALVAFISSCGVLGECGKPTCSSVFVPPHAGEFNADGFPPSHGPHADSLARTATISADGQTLIVRYERKLDGQQVVETWTIGQ